MARGVYVIPLGCHIRSVQKPIEFVALYLPEPGDPEPFPVELYRHHHIDVIDRNGQVVHELIGEIRIALN